MVNRSADRSYFIYILIALATIAVYWQVHDFGFVAIDDFVYASENPRVLGGISFDSIRWAFTTTSAANWHPLTWISLMLDAQVANRFVPSFARKPSAGVFHVTNAALHVLSTLILFAALRLMTGEKWKSAFVAALFGLHPLHVESVAWVSERKDTLSGLFWMLTMLAYAKYAQKRTLLRYGATLALFALGLMSKPMLVSLPIVLLAMDYWPLGRLKVPANKGNQRPTDNRQPPTGTRSLASLFLEKLPLFALAAASCAVTLWAQSGGGAVVESQLVPAGQRLSNAAVSVVAYIVKAVSPLNLAAFYPHPGPTLPVWQVAASVAAIGAFCAVAIACARRCPAVTVGWFWYVVTLAPVAGIVQVGAQAMADRYTYLPLIGLFVAVTWGASDLLALAQTRPKSRLLAASLQKTLALAVLAGLAVTSYFEAGYWRDTITLMEHAVSVTENNYYAHTVLGAALHRAGRYEEAFEHCVEAIRLRPGYSAAHYRLARTMAAKNLLHGAVAHYRIALRTDPNNADIHNDLGCALGRLGDLDAAAVEFEKALRLNPNHRNARKNLNAIHKLAEKS